MSRKRKLYLSELLIRYNEINDLYQIEIFPKNEGQWLFYSKQEALDYLTEEYLKKEVDFWEVDNEYIGIFLK